MGKLSDVPRQTMPEQDSIERGKNFNEVALGYAEETAVLEASRCMQCKKPKCVEGCPVEIDIPAFIEAINERRFDDAIRIVKEKNNLPAICGRVCPQETQCEIKCVLGIKKDPVAIGRLERFVADYELAVGVAEPERAPRKGHKVAVVGSGPGGLTAAADLARMGYDVTIFEAFHDTGGVLRYGIPEFRLPKAIVSKEVDYIRRLGVDIETNVIVGKTVTIKGLMQDEGYEAVFIAVGAGLPYFKGIPGENLIGVYSANEFLTRVNLMSAYRFPEADTPVIIGKRVAVEGGGNVAMDSARTSLRLGADKVYIVYRRSEVEMPARAEEVHHAKDEGIVFNLLTTISKVFGDDDGRVRAVECIRMELGEPDSSGRRRPVPIEGSEFTIDVDMVVMAIGSGANPLLTGSTPELELNKRGYIVADTETGRTTIEGVYAGGDIVTGAATVIEAMGAGKRAARAIDAYITSKSAS
jgi:glutamate synthase (NADPH/NADH) small chain